MVEKNKKHWYKNKKLSSEKLDDEKSGRISSR